MVYMCVCCGCRDNLNIPSLNKYAMYGSGYRPTCCLLVLKQGEKLRVVCAMVQHIHSST